MGFREMSPGRQIRLVCAEHGRARHLRKPAEELLSCSATLRPQLSPVLGAAGTPVMGCTADSACAHPSLSLPCDRRTHQRSLAPSQTESVRHGRQAVVEEDSWRTTCRSWGTQFRANSMSAGESLSRASASMPVSTRLAAPPPASGISLDRRFAGTRR